VAAEDCKNGDPVGGCREDDNCEAFGQFNALDQSLERGVLKLENESRGFGTSYPFGAPSYCDPPRILQASNQRQYLIYGYPALPIWLMT
jgi:hypothetical protein